MNLLLRALQKEVLDEGHVLINEVWGLHLNAWNQLLSFVQSESWPEHLLCTQPQGEPGSKLYIVESGTLEISINGIKVRDMGKGSMLGELALLYDAPRSATVRLAQDIHYYTKHRLTAWFNSVLEWLNFAFKSKKSFNSFLMVILFRCKTRCILWSLQREAFKHIQAEGASTRQMHRARWGRMRVVL